MCTLLLRKGGMGFGTLLTIRF